MVLIQKRYSRNKIQDVLYLSEFSSSCEGQYPVKYSASTVNGAVIAVWFVISNCLLIDLPMTTGSCSLKSSVIGWWSASLELVLNIQQKKKEDDIATMSWFKKKKKKTKQRPGICEYEVNVALPIRMQWVGNSERFSFRKKSQQ